MCTFHLNYTGWHPTSPAVVGAPFRTWCDDFGAQTDYCRFGLRTDYCQFGATDYRARTDYCRFGATGYCQFGYCQARYVQDANV